MSTKTLFDRLQLNLEDIREILTFEAKIPRFRQNWIWMKRQEDFIKREENNNR